MTHVTISSRLVPNPPPLTLYVPPLRTDWDNMFQPLFNELLNPPLSVDPSTPKVIAPIAEVVALEPTASTGSPSSTIVDQDAPLPSNSQTIPKTQSPVISNDVEEENHDLNVKPFTITAIVQHSNLNANSKLICVNCNGCILFDNHDLCVLNVIIDVNARPKSKSVKKTLKRKVWKPTGKVVQIILLYLDSGSSKHMTGDRSQLTNFVNKFVGTIKFRNDHVAKIMGYGDYQIMNVMISRVYYMKGLGHKLFFVRQFCDSNLEVAFRQHTGFIRNLD
nr:integrase, catalytic region, zinc finger, CCHC-type, peptidase aspartic, catalytic [Tanacetum cinerariifolium]